MFPPWLNDRQDARRSYIVFLRVRLKDMENKAFTPAATLEVALATLVNGACSGVCEATFPAFFNKFAAADELDTVSAAAKEPGDDNIFRVGEALGRFAERVRGGQMVISDINGDGIPDLVQVAKMPGTLNFRTAVLLGSIDAAGLRFTVAGQSRP